MHRFMFYLAELFLGNIWKESNFVVINRTMHHYLVFVAWRDFTPIFSWICDKKHKINQRIIDRSRHSWCIVFRDLPVICNLARWQLKHERKTRSSKVPPNAFTVEGLFLSCHWLFDICILHAGRAPVLAVATTLEQMSHLVCVISVVGWPLGL